MSAGVPAGRGRGRGLRTETKSEAPVGVSSGAASWGSGNLGAPIVTPSTDTTEDAEFVIDWDSINANREESERARYIIELWREIRDFSQCILYRFRKFCNAWLHYKNKLNCI